MCRRTPRLRTLILACTVPLAGLPPPAAAQPAGPVASACGWLALPKLEAALGAPAKPITGTDRSGFHSCLFASGPAASAKIEHQAPGQPGLPGDAASGIAGARQTVGATAKDFESQVIGEVGCYRMTLAFPGVPATRSTTCFAPKGYLVLTLSRADAFVPFTVVHELLLTTLPRTR